MQLSDLNEFMITANAGKTNSKVSFQLISKLDRVLKEEKDTSCFASITYSQIPASSKLILIPKSKSLIPYSDEQINRWIETLNELKFPCSVRIGKNSVTFKIELKDYTYKLHLSSTLQLIRCLFETGICIVPALYFYLLKQDPQKDHFILLQDAHRLLHAKECGIGFYGNTNHMCTFNGNGDDNVTMEQFYKKLNKSDYKIHDNHSYDHKICNLWRGSYEQKY